jgi:signal transduction histidine kinase
MLRSHAVALVMPLTQGENMTGYVMLGDHKSGSYTKRDLDVLQAVNNELVIAIQNALSLHEVKELNATLQQRIDVATKELRASNAQLKHLDEVKDEFISMASHQLRTPLTSVKGYLSMVLDGDVGKINAQQEKVLAEAFNSSERMVRLIADFLNVSRLQTGKFVIDKSETDIRKIVEQEAKNIQVMDVGRSLKINVSVPKSSVVVQADASKLREVIMNFIDNAIYYSRPDTAITVKLVKEGGELVFTVTDSGIGVPESEQARLFNKFYRASNARKQRPDGTGIGLYPARRIIAAHSGSVIFRSVEGRGSTFGFRMPLDHPTKSD